MESSVHRAIVRMGIGLEGRETLKVRINGAPAIGAGSLQLVTTASNSQWDEGALRRA
jgi:hypothetical protein